MHVTPSRSARSTLRCWPSRQSMESSQSQRKLRVPLLKLQKRMMACCKRWHWTTCGTKWIYRLAGRQARTIWREWLVGSLPPILPWRILRKSAWWAWEAPPRMRLLIWSSACPSFGFWSGSLSSKAHQTKVISAPCYMLWELEHLEFWELVRLRHKQQVWCGWCSGCRLMFAPHGFICGPSSALILSHSSCTFFLSRLEIMDTVDGGIYFMCAFDMPWNITTSFYTTDVSRWWFWIF